MTSLTLLLWIVLGISVQLALWLGIEFWHHWREYQNLRSTDGEATATSATPAIASPPPTAADAAAHWAGWRPFRVARRQIEDAAQSVCSFYLVPVDGQPLPDYLPGQFITFQLDMPALTAGAPAEHTVRCYTLSDAPRPEHYRVSIKRVPAGRASPHFHDQVQVGSLVQVRAPSGHFHIDRGTTPVVLIAGGIGITPMLAMLNWCLKHQPERELSLYYGVRHGGEVVMREQLDALATAHPNFQLRYCFSNPQPDEIVGRDFHHHGRVDIALLRQQLALKPYHFYICGPTNMMESLVTGLEDWGVAESQIHFEAFGPASIKPRPAHDAALDTAPSRTDSDLQISFSKSGKTLPWQAASGSLLEFAEANGISVDSACRAGACGACQTTLLAGEVSYSSPPDFDPDAGSCLLCVGIPKTSLTLEA